jgi:MtfA peptidase
MDSWFIIPLLIAIVIITVLRNYSRFMRENKDALLEEGVMPVKLEEGYEQILSDKFSFYNTLDEKQKILFCRRLEHFVKHRIFQGREGFIVTEESRILISAAAIRLTFGLNDYMLSDFHDILIYPHTFYSKFSRTNNKGETNPHGIIVFSWPDVVEGFRTVEDHINLAYHEFAHALLLQDSTQGLADSMFPYGYQLLNHALMKKHLSQRAHHDNLFRDYAYTNKMEFFAVATEYFLESPEYLREKCSELYDIMMRTLRQDPISKQYGLSFQYAPDFWEYYNTDPTDAPF